jgi:hypothetical protein
MPVRMLYVRAWATAVLSGLPGSSRGGVVAHPVAAPSQGS